MQPARACYGQRFAPSAVEEIICPSFAQREFATDEEANEYARRVFAHDAFAVADTQGTNERSSN